MKLGFNLLSALTAKNFFIPSACGGNGSCGMCKCKILKGGGKILSTEKNYISFEEESKNIRLACQVKVRQDMSVELINQNFFVKQFAGTVISNDNISTFIKHIYIKINNNDVINFKAGSYIQMNALLGVYQFQNFKISDSYKNYWDKVNLWRYTTNISKGMFRAYSLANCPAKKKKY